MIAVNLSAERVDLSQDVAAGAWWPMLPGLTYQGVDELTTGWSGTAWAGRFADTIPRLRCPDLQLAAAEAGRRTRALAL